MNPTLRQLEAFALCARQGSLTAAAERMGLTPSAISLLLRQLETELGLRLLDRTTRRLQLTEAGRDALEGAERVLQERSRLLAGVQGLAARQGGQLVIAASAAIAAVMIPGMLRDFTERHPGIRLVLRDVSPDRVAPMVEEGAAEIGLGTVGEVPTGIRTETLLSDQLSAICRRDAPLASRQRLSWAEALREPCISVVPGNPIRTLIDETLAAQGRSLEPAWEVSFFATALSLTAGGFGIALLPGYLVGQSPAMGLLALPLEEPKVQRDVVLVLRAGRSLSPAASAFMAVARRSVSARP
ncbi:LysR family transcriptional regulator [Roseomonas chloroacetimidivorans]|uniref:LysR family transcriptional regulator n=1 Tax=Roseomonas chloroacetimidivorans TaxID=1766656 RepID=UPI003C759F11